MNRYQSLVKNYYKELITPKLNIIECIIVIVCLVTLWLSIYLQFRSDTLLSVGVMLIAALGLKHVMENDSRRKRDKIKIKYVRFCQAQGVRPIDPASIKSIEDARKAWFCMAHKVEPKDLLDVAMAMRSHYAVYRELESLQSISYAKAAQLLLWFDTSRLLSFLAIVAALCSVVFLAGVTDVVPIFETFFIEVLPVLFFIDLNLFVAYFLLLVMVPVLPGILGAFDVMQVMGRSAISDRAIRNYIYGLMRASD